MTRTHHIILLIATLAVGCGSDTGKTGDNRVDINVEDDAGTDSGVSDDDAGTSGGDSGAPNNALPDGCIANGIELETTFAEQDASRLAFGGGTAAVDGLTDELYFVHRTAEPAVGTLELDANFADCTNCLVVQTGCDSEGCLATYMAQTGSIELLELGETLRASLSGLTLERVAIDEEGQTSVIDGDAYCIDDLDISATLEVDPCSDWPDPSLADTNCGTAPLTVTFNVSGFQAESEEFVYLSIDFGDGETYYSTTDAVTSHTFQTGEWDVQIEAVGYIAGSRVTLTTPERIRAY